MPQSPRSVDLGVVLDRLAERCDAAVDELLLTLPIAGDRDTQAVVDGYLDQVMDALRMLAVTGRETHACLRTGPLARTTGPAEQAHSAEPARLAGWSGPPGWSR